MSGVVIFESKYGDISFEADESVLEALEAHDSGVQSLSGDGSDVSVRASIKFNDALQSLHNYVSSMQDVVQKLTLKPKEVSVEVGVTLKGSAGFVIAKAGAETSMKLTLKWEP